MTDSHDDPPLSERELLLTMWVDGAMTPRDRARFDELVADDPELARLAAQHKELLDFSRSEQLMEPSDKEARRFWSRFYNRGEWQLGWCLFLFGTILLLGFCAYELFSSDLHVLIKIGCGAIAVGGSILLWNTFRLRLRTSRFDRYRGVLY